MSADASGIASRVSAVATQALEAPALAKAGKLNPLAALFDGLRQVIVASLRLTASLVRFSSVTVPSAIYAVLHYSFTLQLNFPSLALLFISSLVATFVWLRYRHLNRYERLREVPLTKDEGFNLHPDVSGTAEDGERGGGFHNYLDEFLQAIRIFGYLDKPVFHELARHLQTRRLIAGDTLSLDSDFSFYIVIDGNVQVYAPTPEGPDGGAAARADGFDDEEHNGYQLLNEVGSGGTLSSLFTILSLFTEDVKLGFGDDENVRSTGVGANTAGLDGLRRRPGQRPVRSDDTAAQHALSLRPGGNQLQLNAAALRNVPSAMGATGAVERLDALSHLHPTRRVPSSRGTDDGETVHQGDDASTVLDPNEHQYATGQPGAGGLREVSPAPDLLPPAQAAAPFTHFQPSTPAASSSGGRRTAAGTPGSANFSPPFMAETGRAHSSTTHTTEGRPATPGSILSGFSGLHSHEARGRPSDSMHHEGVGTVARAVTDTTLAVIPAEAFKRLTKRYPNAAAHIVQVILTRLSRVTFHTAHKYLGLTKEVMRTEKHINELACFTLPAAFYEQGGMERLRQRFLPEPNKNARPSQEGSFGAAAVDIDDYFRDAKQPRHASSSSRGGASADTSPELRRRGGREGSGATARPAKTPWGHPDAPLRTPTSRTSVGPGDLFSMTGTDEMGRPSSPLSYLVATPRPRRGTKVEDFGTLSQNRTSTSSERVANFGARSTEALVSPQGRGSEGAGSESDAASFAGFGTGVLANFDLKDAVMSCIARSIGLAQAPASDSPLASMSASPFINPADAVLQRGVFKSAFSSLSMLDAAMSYEDESSVTGASSAFGVQHADLENEVDVRFFPAGSTLARAGENAAGLFYVIDGFLDVIVPPDVDQKLAEKEFERPAGPKPKAPTRHPSTSRPAASRTGTARPEATRRTSAAVPKPQAGKIGARPASTGGAPTSSSRIGNALDGTHAGAVPRPAIRSRPAGGKVPGPIPGPVPSMHNGPSFGLPEDRKEGPRAIYSVGRGGIAGYLSSLLGAPSYVDVVAKTDTYVGVLPAKALERVMERRPIVLLTLCKRLLSLLSPLILQIDSALEWESVNAGQVIYREGDPSDSFYIVINGRLRAITERTGGGVEEIQEYGQGDSVGELDVITRSPRRKTLHAIRDSELARMPMTLFNAISVRHPAITIQISRIIARRVRDEVATKHRQSMPMLQSPPVPGLPDLGRNNLNLKTVAILPVTRDVPISDFANRLQAAFEDTIGGPTAFLNQSSVMGVLGRHAFNRMGKLKLAGWLAEQEQRYRLVLYVVDTAVSSPWAQTSIRQADCVLLVGFGDDPTTGEYERLLLGIKTTARKELVLLHPERNVPPGATRAWLKSRPWISAHHHVELPGISRSHAAPTSPVDPKAVKALRTLKAKLETRLQRYTSKTSGPVPGRPHHFSDFARLARRLTGKSIGLVLGGGGARGCAHIGFLRALEERGIPVDMVGGTSIGSLVGGLYAKEAEMVTTFGRAKKFAGRMASIWRFVTDLTYPVVSYTTGHEFNRGVFKALGETHIEDMWLPFFCNTTNITWSRMEVHTTGYAWRYIRGSMTLAGLIPPLVDDGHMLVDGGYMDNLPVSVMMAMGAHDVFAVDVGSIDDTSPRSYGDTLSGWWVLINKWNPWSDAHNIPSITDIQGRLTYVSSAKTLEEAKNTPGCFYIKMPVEGTGTMEFAKFTETELLGYDAACRALDGWAKEGSLPTGMSSEIMPGLRRRGVGARRNSV